MGVRQKLKIVTTFKLEKKNLFSRKRSSRYGVFL